MISVSDILLYYYSCDHRLANQAAIGGCRCRSPGPGWKFPTGTQRSPRNSGSVCEQHSSLPCQHRNAAV
ncbi:unnamed protein product, partial [Staurois parvus]